TNAIYEPIARGLEGAVEVQPEKQHPRDGSSANGQGDGRDRKQSSSPPNLGSLNAGKSLARPILRILLGARATCCRVQVTARAAFFVLDEYQVLLVSSEAHRNQLDDR